MKQKTWPGRNDRQPSVMRKLFIGLLRGIWVTLELYINFFVLIMISFTKLSDYKHLTNFLVKDLYGFLEFCLLQIHVGKLEDFAGSSKGFSFYRNLFEISSHHRSILTQSCLITFII